MSVQIGEVTALPLEEWDSNEGTEGEAKAKKIWLATHHPKQTTLMPNLKMKALSVKEPWAGLIRSGKKTIETRTWKTHYRGPLLICASATPKTMLSGNAVCIVELVDCRVMEKSDEDAACCEIYPDAYAWVLRDIQPIEPFPVKGQLQIFEVDTPVRHI